MESILTSIKKLLGIDEEYTHFDTDIIIHINSVLMTLNQLGIGPVDGFSITDDTETWGDFLEDVTILEAVKTYVLVKVRMMFDPPTSSVVLQAFERIANEMEWRLTLQGEGVEPVV